MKRSGFKMARLLLKRSDKIKELTCQELVSVMTRLAPSRFVPLSSRSCCFRQVNSKNSANFNYQHQHHEAQDSFKRQSRTVNRRGLSQQLIYHSISLNTHNKSPQESDNQHNYKPLSGRVVSSISFINASSQQSEHPTDINLLSASRFSQSNWLHTNHHAILLPGSQYTHPAPKHLQHGRTIHSRRHTLPPLQSPR